MHYNNTEDERFYEHSGIDFKALGEQWLEWLPLKVEEVVVL